MGADRIRRLGAIGAATLANATSVLLLQVLALVTLEPADFGRFSAVYLLFGLASSVLLSTVCEAWQRREPRAPWEDYSTMLVLLSVLTGLVGLAVTVSVGALRPVAVPVTVALVCAVYRTGARYRSVQRGENRYVLAADLGATVVLLAAVAVILRSGDGLDRLEVIAWAWALSSLVAALLSTPPRLAGRGVVARWRRQHGPEIRTLLADSAILDVAAIGVPYAMIPVLSIAGFGTYRALSNVSTPVKLVLSPLRPLFSSRGLRWFVQPRVVAAVVGGGVLMGAAGAVVLVLVRHLDLDLGTLSSLAEYWVFAGVFIASTFANGVYYLVGRTHFDRRTLLSGRVAASAVGVVLPVLGALLDDVRGAIAGATTSTVLVAVLWALLARRAAGRRGTVGEDAR